MAEMTRPPSPVQTFARWQMDQQGFLLTDAACDIARRCWLTAISLLDQSVDRKNEDSIAEFHAVWALAVKLYLEVLGRFMWTRSIEIERILRATELYAVSVGVTRPRLDKQWFRAESDIDFLSTCFSLALATELDDLEDALDNRLDEIKEEKERKKNT